MVAPGLWLGDKRDAMDIISKAKASAVGSVAAGDTAVGHTPPITAILNVSDKAFYMPMAPGWSPPPTHVLTPVPPRCIHDHHTTCQCRSNICVFLCGPHRLLLLG